MRQLTRMERTSCKSVGQEKFLRYGPGYTQRNLFEILLNQPEIRLYLSFFRLIWIQTKVHLDPNQSENGKYNLISG